MTDGRTGARRSAPGGVTLATVLACAVLAGLAGGCSGDYSAKTKKVNRLEDLAGPPDKREPKHRVFGNIGLGARGNVSEGLVDFGLLGSTDGAKGEDALPVNKYLWRATLDVLSFMPLNSTDPYTGVIATDWGAADQAPGERFKVTAYMIHHTLSAASLKVSVHRQERSAEGTWIQAPVDPGTAVKLEDAILTRARQIKVAEEEEQGEAS